MTGRVKKWMMQGLLACFFFGVSDVRASSLEPQKPPPPSKVVPAPKAPVKTEDGRVKRLQQLLAEGGFYPGQANGSLDAATQEAIQRGQKAYKLKLTGKYDPQLIDILLKEVRSKPSHYQKKILMEASAYTTEDPGSGLYTKRGNRLRKGLVAVDPKIIPLGTRLYVDGYGYAIADDIGGAVKGNKIDLAYEKRQDALQFGRQTISVYILN